MDLSDLEAAVEEIAGLIRDRRWDLALALTEQLEARVADAPIDAPPFPPAVRDLLAASKQLTQSLVALRNNHVH
jgi:hypothetical protein